MLERFGLGGKVPAQLVHAGSGRETNARPPVPRISSNLAGTTRRQTTDYTGLVALERDAGKKV